MISYSPFDCRLENRCIHVRNGASDRNARHSCFIVDTCSFNVNVGTYGKSCPDSDGVVGKSKVRSENAAKLLSVFDCGNKVSLNSFQCRNSAYG